MADAGEFDDLRPGPAHRHRRGVARPQNVGLGAAQHQGRALQPVVIRPEVDVGDRARRERRGKAGIEGEAEPSVAAGAPGMRRKVAPLRVAERAEAAIGPAQIGFELVAAMRSSPSFGRNGPTSFSTSRRTGWFGSPAKNMPTSPPSEVPTQSIAAVSRRANSAAQTAR